jgi:hypothetical protein
MKTKNSDQEIETRFNKQFFNYLRSNSDNKWVKDILQTLLGKNAGKLYFSQKSFNRKTPDQIGENESVMIVFENKTISKTNKSQFINYSNILMNDSRKEKYFVFLAPKYKENSAVFNKFSTDSGYGTIKYIHKDLQELSELAEQCSAPDDFLQFIRIHSKEFNYNIFDSLFGGVIDELKKRGVIAGKNRPTRSKELLKYHQLHFLYKGIKNPEFRLRIGFQASDTDRFIVAWYKFQCGKYAYTMNKENEDAAKYIKALKNKGINDPDLFNSINESARKVHSVYEDLQNRYDFAYIPLSGLYRKSSLTENEISYYADLLEKEFARLFEFTIERLAFYGCRNELSEYLS